MRISAAILALAALVLASPAAQAAGRCHVTLRVSTPGFVTYGDQVYAAAEDGRPDDMFELGRRFAELHARHPDCHIEILATKETLFGNIMRLTGKLFQAGFDRDFPDGKRNVSIRSFD